MNILENGIDSLQKALKKLNNIEKVDKEKVEFELKDIIINLHHSIETLVKYLIREKNEYLIYEKLDKVFENERIAKESKKNTIQFLDAINRMVILYEIKISDNDYDKIKDLNEIRNAITHYEINLDIFEIQHLISNILKIMIPIFSNTIRDFNKYLEKIGLNKDIELMYNNDDFLVIKELFDFIIILDECLIKAELIKGDDINKKYKLRNENIKKNKVIYSTCDICSKDFFVETVKVFIGSEMVDSLGYCEFCGFNKSKEYIFLDRYFKNTWYETIENINSIDIICTFIEKFNGFFSNYKEEKDKEEQFSKLKHDIYSKKTNLTNVLIRYLENRLSKLDKEINRIDLFISNNLCDIVEEYNDIMYYIEVYFKIFNEDILKSNDLNSLFKDSKKQIEEIINRMSIFIKERLEKAKEVESYINNFYREENSYYYDLLNNELNSSIICGDIWDNLDGEYSKWGIIHKIEDITILREYFVQKISRGIEEVSVVLIECEIVTAQYCGDGDFSSNLERIYVEIEITSIEDLEPKIKVTYIKFAKQY